MGSMSSIWSPATAPSDLMGAAHQVMQAQQGSANTATQPGVVVHVNTGGFPAEPGAGPVAGDVGKIAQPAAPPPANSAAPASPGAAPAGQPALPGYSLGGPPPASLMADPAYNAFLNSLGLTDANLRNAAALRAGQTWIGEQGNEGPLARQFAQGQDHTERVFNSRGLVNSSDNLNAQNIMAENYGDRLAAMRNAAANSVANLYTTLAGRLAQGQQNLATTGTGIAGNDYVANQVATQANPFLTGS